MASGTLPILSSLSFLGSSSSGGPQNVLQTSLSGCIIISLITLSLNHLYVSMALISICMLKTSISVSNQISLGTQKDLFNCLQSVFPWIPWNDHQLSMPEVLPMIFPSYPQACFFSVGQVYSPGWAITLGKPWDDEERHGIILAFPHSPSISIYTITKPCQLSHIDSASMCVTYWVDHYLHWGQHHLSSRLFCNILPKYSPCF